MDSRSEKQLKVVLTGATGFIGSAVARALLDEGHEVLGISRRADQLQQEPEEGMRWSTLEEADFSGFDAVVHLSGEPIFPGRWTQAKKDRIVTSRVEGTQEVVKKMAACSTPPKVLLCASGSGYYGRRVDAPVAEDAPAGEGFLAQVCVDWEAAADEAEALGCRVVQMRLGILLGPGASALNTMVPVFKWGIGGPLGSGKQPLAWIDLRDVVDFISVALVREDVSGPVNLVAGAPAQKDFARALGKALSRPAFMPAPSFAIQLLYGEAASAVLGGQNVVCQQLKDWGLAPKHSDLLTVLQDAIEA
ncbi:MAG: TIGR01777 family oxidoreductase [Myxococcota bacterium]|nr:TIGR01777 family oxidoreductase [Myxococcota bacterium]